MSKKVSIIDLSTSLIRACDKALQTLFQVHLNDIPEISKRSVMIPKISAPNGYISALIKISYSESKSSGYVIVKIEKSKASQVLQDAGMGDKFSDQELADSCGELCNLVAGFFKTELSKHTGIHLDISTPKLFLDLVDQNIEDVSVNQRYLITVFYKKYGQLLDLEMAFEDKEES